MARDESRWCNISRPKVMAKVPILEEDHQYNFTIEKGVDAKKGGVGGCAC